jgi:hypothetical protein
MTGSDARNPLIRPSNRTIKKPQSQPHPTSKRPHSHQQIRTAVRVVEPNKTTSSPARKPIKPKHPPQLTTNPEHPLFPHPIGPTTALDFPLPKNIPQKNPP